MRRVDVAKMPNSHPRRYAIPNDALAWREWDGEVVVFSQVTGSTHLLGEFGSEIFGRLVNAERAATVESLAAELADDPGGADAAALSAAVAEVLSDFARRGIAHPDTP